MNNTEFHKPIEITFPAKIVGADFYTLDGSKKITMRTYCRYIKNPSELTIEELKYIVMKFSQLKDQLDELQSLVKTIINF